MITYVTATEWGVSTTSGSDIEGVQLDIYRIVPRIPTPDNPLKFDVEYRVKKMPFPDSDSARDWAFQNGYLKVYEPKSESAK